MAEGIDNRVIGIDEKPGERVARGTRLKVPVWEGRHQDIETGRADMLKL